MKSTTGLLLSMRVRRMAMTIVQVQKLIGTAKKAVNDALYEVGNLDINPEVEAALEDLSTAYRKVTHAGATLHNLQGHQGGSKS
jgi:hypothetical protein